MLGVDLGDVRIGLALSDPDATVATPLATLHVADADDPASIVDRLVAVAQREGAGTVVVGLPRALSGREGRPAQRAREVARLLAEHGLDVDLRDERFTTVEAERVMLAQRVRRRERRQAVDRVAATLLLQTYLDARRSESR
ncbi:MAG TPA: Holliday junction resolvase RuvX [Nitriliruptorales bacterium]|nr:Holliday junction resolvase RuvX [Nitriliruptorales bacterium]